MFYTYGLGFLDLLGPQWAWLVGAREPERSGWEQGKKAPLGPHCLGAAPKPGSWRIPGHQAWRAAFRRTQGNPECTAQLATVFCGPVKRTVTGRERGSPPPLGELKVGVQSI